MIFERRGRAGAEVLYLRHEDRLFGLGDRDPLQTISPAGSRELAAELAAGRLERAPDAALAARLGPPVPRVGKLISVGLNFTDHARETSLPIPDEPIYFLKAPETIVGPNDDVVRPAGESTLDWEVELAIVIGAPAHRLGSPADADTCIAGYTISHDVSVRDWQIDPPTGWDRSKATPTFNPLGPRLVTPDELDDVDALSLRTRVNGVVRQDGTTADMQFGPRFLVWHLSHQVRLNPGDVISTGTPAGVSYGHPDVPFLEPGDVVEVEIEGIGAIRNRIVAEKA
ncbi:MAG: fumarylacetoacetate hydrolase family protein [Microbacteriaceae bacterium]|nr:fumarylacetoacetate hydrolase family protein [Microbacteriaceae bacterium]